MSERKHKPPALKWIFLIAAVALGTVATVRTFDLEELRAQNQHDARLTFALEELENDTLQLVRAATTLDAHDQVEERIERVRSGTVAIVEEFHEDEGIPDLPMFKAECFEAIRTCVALSAGDMTSVEYLAAEQQAWRASGDCMDHIDDLADTAVQRLQASLVVIPGRKGAVYTLYVLTAIAIILTGWLFVDRDSIERARRRAEETERRLQAIVEHQLDYFCRFLPDTTVIDANDAYLQATGMKREQVVGQRFIDWIDEDDKERMLQHIQSLTPDQPAAVIVHGVTTPAGERQQRQWVDLGIFDPDGKLIELQSVGRDITERERMRREAEERSATLSSFFNASPSAMDILQIEDDDIRIVDINETASALLNSRPDDVRGKLASEYGVDRETIDLWIAECQKAAKSGAPRRFEYQSSIKKRWLSVRVCAIERQDAGPPMFAAVTEDITEHRNTEQWLRLLNRELNHRVKNNLAVVSALADRTAASTDDFEAFTDQLRARIQGMKLAHDVISQRQWTSASLESLIRRCLSDFMQRGESEIRVEGPEVDLSPRQASMLGLVVRELAVNAAKYGGLSLPAGIVDVRWIVESIGDGQRINLTWRERGGPEVKAPSETGFGFELIEQIVMHSLEGEFSSAYALDGFECRISIPGGDQHEESLVAQGRSVSPDDAS